jgi:hypothetical protein
MILIGLKCIIKVAVNKLSLQGHKTLTNILIAQQLWKLHSQLRLIQVISMRKNIHLVEMVSQLFQRILLLFTQDFRQSLKCHTD